MAGTIISLCVSGAMLIVSVITFILARHKDTKETVKEEAENAQQIRESLIRQDLKLDQISKTATETSQEVKAMNGKIVEHEKEIAVIKRDLNTAFIRIDELKEGKYNHV